MCAQEPAAVDARNAPGNTPLGVAVDRGDLETVRLLVELGADPHQRNRGGTSLLERAAMAGHRPVADYLVGLGCAMTATDAAMLGRLDVLGAALARDPSALEVADSRRGYTLLHYAAWAGCAESARWLLARGAEVDAPGRAGHTPLSMTEAAGRGRGVEVARVLLEAGADPNAPAGWHGGTVLHRAVMNRDLELARLLLDCGADPERPDMSGLSARARARSVSRAMAELFQEASRDPPARPRGLEP